MSGLLLDTHILLWTSLEPARLSKAAQEQIQDATQLYVSAITLYEVVYLALDGRVQLALDPHLWFQTMAARLDLVVLPVTAEIAGLAASLARYPNGDPADRLIVSTAIHLNVSLCTADRNMRRYHKSKPAEIAFEVIW